jgi:hypothetical protein
MTIEKAKLRDGRTVEFNPTMIAEGAMKQVYFTPDKSSVLCFFKDQNDHNRIMRLDAVLGRFNPTTDSVTGSYFSRLYCWPTGIVTSPRLGVMCPAYPQNYYFRAGPWKGKEKKGKWFTGKAGGTKPFRDMMPPEERGIWLNYFRLCICMARAVRRLHLAGLAHSDLSANNILIDPATGQSIVIDIDSLVVPGIFPPDVVGTDGYIAPEVLATANLPLKDQNRKSPCVSTDQHALAVLIYEYLLFRHPLKGPKVNSTTSAEDDDLLSMGSKALFIEHQTDRSNRPIDVKPECHVLGPLLKDLFVKAFITGLHAPRERPCAMDWERGLLRTWDLMHPCPNASCTHKWFVLSERAVPQCSFCGAKIAATIPRLRLRKEVRPGQWVRDGDITVYNGINLFKWHVFDNISPNESLQDSDKVPLADCQVHEGRWLLINRKLTSLTSPGGNRVPPGSAVELKPGAQIRLSQEPHGRFAEVELHKTTE